MNQAPKENKQTLSPDSQHLDYIDDKTAALLLRAPKSASIMLWVMALFFVCAMVWASWAELDKVTVGIGKVIPSSQLQVVQNLEGGLVKEVLVQEGTLVAKGQQLLLIDDTRFRSDFREKEQELASLQADSTRLNALLASIRVNESNKGTEQDWRNSVTALTDQLTFTPEFAERYSNLVRRQQAEYADAVSNLKNQLSLTGQQINQKERELVETNARIKNLRRSYEIAQKELTITEPLADEGVVPRIELLKIQRQVNDTKRELTSTELKTPVLTAAIQESIFKRIDIALKFRSEQQAQLNENGDRLSAIQESQVGLEDRVNRTVVVSPVTGTIKKIHVNTVGGVIQPGMDLIEIVPSEDNLLIEAKIAPQDIAFLRPGLQAVIKFTAYDFTVYGGLHGTLEHISADTIQDEEGNSFYLVRVRTEQNNLGEGADALPIIPGMTASADIITGKRTVLDYLLKPVLQARHSALRE